jgi:hypothetical protein
VGAAVVSGVDAPPIFEPSEHVFDFVARRAFGIIGSAAVLIIVLIVLGFVHRHHRLALETRMITSL